MSSQVTSQQSQQQLLAVDSRIRQLNRSELHSRRQAETAVNPQVSEQLTNKLS